MAQGAATSGSGYCSTASWHPTVVWLAALPLVAFRFHLVSPIGIFLNIPLIPLTSAAMLLGGSLWCCQRRGARSGARWRGPPPGYCSLTQTIVLWGVAQPLGHRFVVGPTWGWVLVFYALLALAALAATKTARQADPRRTRRFARRGVVVAAAGWIVPGWWLGGIGRGKRHPGDRIPGRRPWPGGLDPHA